MCMPCWRDFTCGRGWLDFCAKWTKVWVPQQVSRDFLHEAFMFVSVVTLFRFSVSFVPSFSTRWIWNAGSLRYKCVVGCVRDVAMIRFYKFLCQDCVFALCSRCFGLSLFYLESFSKVSWESGFVCFFSGSEVLTKKLWRRTKSSSSWVRPVPWVGMQMWNFVCAVPCSARASDILMSEVRFSPHEEIEQSQRGTFVGNALGRRVSGRFKIWTENGITSVPRKRCRLFGKDATPAHRKQVCFAFASNIDSNSDAYSCSREMRAWRGEFLAWKFKIRVECQLRCLHYFGCKWDRWKLVAHCTWHSQSQCSLYATDVSSPILTWDLKGGV